VDIILSAISICAVLSEAEGWKRRTTRVFYELGEGRSSSHGRTSRCHGWQDGALLFSPDA
jgi:hypothetical protein